jgi:hypothetical protein
LEETLLDLYAIYGEEDQKKNIEKKTGHLKVATELYS